MFDLARVIEEARQLGERRQQRQAGEEILDQLRELRLRCHELFAFAPDGYLVTDGHGVIGEANFAAASLFRTRSEFLVDKPLAFFIAREFRAGFYNHLQALRRGQGSVQNWRACLRPLKGEGVHVTVSAAPALDERGSGHALNWQLRDVTARVLAEDALASERSFAAGVVNAAPAIILVLSPIGRILRANPFLETVAGYPARSVLGRSWEWLFLEGDRPTAHRLVAQTLEDRNRVHGTSSLVTQAGEIRAVAWSMELLPGGLDGEPAVLAIGNDITDLHHAQQQALQAERLAAIGQMTASIVHEGRNVLQRSSACLERLGWRLAQQPESLELVSRVQRANADLARLFEDVRTYAAPLVLDRAPCQLAEVWREVWEQTCSLFPGRPAGLSEQTTGVNLWCHGDRRRLGQVFRNIFENAFAACSAEVRVDILCREEVQGALPVVRVLVRDNGPGFTGEQRQRIFEPFYTTRPHGTGLGMAIAKRIMEAHGGQIAADNAPQGGGEIMLTLPRSAS